MSRLAEEAFDRRLVSDRAECERDLVVGAKVWRARSDRIEEGVVRRVEIGRFLSNGDFVASASGHARNYVASFGASGYGPGDWESQTYQWRFFLDKRRAHADLVRQLRRRVEEYQREIKKWEALMAEHEAFSRVGLPCTQHEDCRANAELARVCGAAMEGGGTR